jgi:hypothetical protein
MMELLKAEGNKPPQEKKTMKKIMMTLLAAAVAVPLAFAADAPKADTNGTVKTAKKHHKKNKKTKAVTAQNIVPPAR